MNLTRPFKSGLTALFLLSTASAQATPSPLKSDQSEKGKSPDKYIRIVHQEISAQGRSLKDLRLGILQGMINTKGFFLGV